MIRKILLTGVLIGCTTMAALGARTIREMQRVEMVFAPSVATEGKSWQRGR